MPDAVTSRGTRSGAWVEARELVWTHRHRLAIRLTLMLANRLAGLVLPASSKFLIDDVIANQRVELLSTLAMAIGAATLVQAVTSFALSQVLGVAAQRAITDMRKRVQAHVTRLPIGFFDSTKTGVLISRIMTDAEGIRNLVGTGLVQLSGGLVTAVIALAVLFYLNWQLGAAMAMAFRRLRPLFRERGKINAEVTGRLNETLGGIRIVKAYAVERREQRVFAHGAHRLLRNVARTITGVSGITAVSTLVIGAIGVLMILVGGPRHSQRVDDAGRLYRLHFLHRPDGRAAGPDCVDRHPDHRGVRGPRPDPGDSAYGHGR